MAGLRGVLIRNLSTGAPAAAPLRVCVVGSGPAGFYTAHQLIKVDSVVCLHRVTSAVSISASCRHTSGHCGAIASAFRFSPIWSGSRSPRGQGTLPHPSHTYTRRYVHTHYRRFLSRIALTSSPRLLSRGIVGSLEMFPWGKRSPYPSSSLSTMPLSW